MSGGGGQRPLKVAIIGGGPAGLGAAMELSKLPFVRWNLYEKKTRISETGGGLSIQPQTWRLLECNGIAHKLAQSDYHRIADDRGEQMRNGRTGELVVETGITKVELPQRRTCRLVRAKLQTAMLLNVDNNHIHVNKRLVSIKHLPDSRVSIVFEDGYTDSVDLLIGADGIRSVVRNHSFPEHDIQYEGLSTYRTIVSKTLAMQIEGIPSTPTFWKHLSGLYVFTCPLGDDDFEVTARLRRSKQAPGRSSWGRSFDLSTILPEYEDFCLPVQRILHLASMQSTQEFDLFSGRRLETVISHGSIALIGDASHPLSGQFGSGVGLALEDLYTLCTALSWAWSSSESLASALDLFDSVRSPYYARLYALIDRFAAVKQAVEEEGLSIDARINERLKRVAAVSEFWMYTEIIQDRMNLAIQERQQAAN